MEIFQFLLSFFLSSLGVALDLLTTSICVRDLGWELEWNKRVKYVVDRWGYKAWIFCLEIPIVIMIALFDVLFSSILFFVGLSWFVGRGFAACNNLKIIVEYRTIGIDEFKKRNESRKQAFRGVSLSDKFKLKLPYLMGLFICFLTFVLLLFVHFSAVTLIRSLILSLVILFLIMSI